MIFPGFPGDTLNSVQVFHWEPWTRRFTETPPFQNLAFHKLHFQSDDSFTLIETQITTKPGNSVGRHENTYIGIGLSLEW